MTGELPGAAPRRFSPSELDDVSGIQPDDLAAEVRVARELDTISARMTVVPSASFADRVMGAIAAEPSPSPVRSAGTALRHGAIGAFLASIRDAWRVTTRSGFPMAVRAQAMALVLVVVALGAGSAAATAGALGLFGPDQSSPGPDPSLVAPTESPPASVMVPSPSAEPSPSVTPSPTPTVEPSTSPGRSEEPSGSDDATDGPDATEDSGSGSDDSDSRSGSGSGSDDDQDTPEPDDTPDSDNSDSGSDDSSSEEDVSPDDD